MNGVSTEDGRVNEASCCKLLRLCDAIVCWCEDHKFNSACLNSTAATRKIKIWRKANSFSKIEYIKKYSIQKKSGKEKKWTSRKSAAEDRPEHSHVSYMPTAKAE